MAYDLEIFSWFVYRVSSSLVNFFIVWSKFYIFFCYSWWDAFEKIKNLFKFDKKLLKIRKLAYLSSEMIFLSLASFFKFEQKLYIFKFP